MKKLFAFSVGAIFLSFSVLAQAMDEDLFKVIEQLTNDKISVWAKDPIIVNAVQEANQRANKTSDEIIRLDQKWRKIDGIDEWIKGFLNNKSAIQLKKYQNKQKGKRTLYPEIFIMDKQGCIVAETDKTTDYWQGDESKFINSFAEGQGAQFIDEPEFDHSTSSYTVQVSVPIVDPATGRAIGAMTAGIDLDALTEYMLDIE